MAFDGQPSPTEKQWILALVIPRFELLCHSSSMWPWVSYPASLGFKSFICKTGQIYPYSSTVLNKIKSLILPFLLYLKMLFSLPAVILPIVHLSAAQVHDHPKPRLSKYADTSYANCVSVFRASCGQDKRSEHIPKGDKTQHRAQRYASKARHTGFLSQVPPLASDFS